MRRAVLSMTTKLIDGSVLEGGGQLLRNSVAFSALLNKNISIHKIRNARKPPGLKNQHEKGIHLVAEICGAEVTGAKLKSCELEFKPGPIRLPGHWSADPGTAGVKNDGDIVPSTLTLHGGTNATMAPQIDYIIHIFLPFLSTHFNLQPSIHIAKRGYYPRGGGKVVITIPSIRRPLPSFNIVERGEVTKIKGEARVGGLPEGLAKKMVGGAKEVLEEAGYAPSLFDIVYIREEVDAAVGSGGGIILWAETTGGCRIGGSGVSEKRKEAEDIGRGAAKELVENLRHEGCVDEHLQDQIIIFMALAEGKSTVRTGPLTLHTKTAIWVAEELTEAKFTLVESEGGVLLSCEGIGYEAPLLNGQS